MLKLISKFILFLLFSCFSYMLVAQNYPVYNHFYNNPFIYNPAEVGTNLKPSVFFTHRQQWTGVTGAPIVSTLSFHTPFNESNISLGLNVSSFNRGLINTTDALITYGYSIPLNKLQSLKLGISAGFINNSIDLTNVDNPDDPALINFLNKNTQLAGNFGIKYHSNGLNIGIALPQLFQPQFTFKESFEEYVVNPFDKIVVMAYYKKRVDSYFKTKKRKRSRYTKKVEAQYAPLELHALYRYSKIGENQFEALAKLNVTSSFWVGASYRQNYGITGNTGFNVQGFTLAYAYEPASKLATNLLNGSHEIQLSYRFGKEVKPKVKTVKPDLGNAKPKTEQNGHKARYQLGQTENVDQSLEGTANKKYIISVKAFKSFADADTYKLSLRKRRFDAKIYVDKKTNTFHVYIADGQKMSNAKKEIKKYKKMRRFRSAKIIRLNK